MFSYSLIPIFPHPLTNIPHHLTRHIELRGTLEAFEVRLAVDFLHHQLVTFDADVDYGEFAQVVADELSAGGVVGVATTFTVSSVAVAAVFVSGLVPAPIATVPVGVVFVSLPVTAPIAIVPVAAVFASVAIPFFLMFLCHQVFPF